MKQEEAESGEGGNKGKHHFLLVTNVLDHIKNI